MILLINYRICSNKIRDNIDLMVFLDWTKEKNKNKNYMWFQKKKKSFSLTLISYDLSMKKKKHEHLARLSIYISKATSTLGGELTEISALIYS